MRILFPTRPLSENGCLGFLDLLFIDKKAMFVEEVYLMVGPKPASLSFAVEFIPLAIMLHKQVEKHTNCCTTRNIQFYGLLCGGWKAICRMANNYIGL